MGLGAIGKHRGPWLGTAPADHQAALAEVADDSDMTGYQASLLPSSMISLLDAEVRARPSNKHACAFERGDSGIVVAQDVAQDVQVVAAKGRCGASRHTWGVRQPVA